MCDACASAHRIDTSLTSYSFMRVGAASGAAQRSASHMMLRHCKRFLLGAPRKADRKTIWKVFGKVLRKASSDIFCF